MVLQVVEFLLEKGADITLCNYDNQTAVHVANCDVQRQLLATNGIQASQMQLLRSSWQGDLEQLQQLLVSQINVKVYLWVCRLVGGKKGTDYIWLLLKKNNFFSHTVPGNFRQEIWERKRIKQDTGVKNKIIKEQSSSLFPFLQLEAISQQRPWEMMRSQGAPGEPLSTCSEAFPWHQCHLYSCCLDPSGLVAVINFALKREPESLCLHNT